MDWFLIGNIFIIVIVVVIVIGIIRYSITKQGNLPNSPSYTPNSDLYGGESNSDGLREEPKKLPTVEEVEGSDKDE